MERQTVKDLKRVLEEMKKVYAYKDESTLVDIGGMERSNLMIVTTDEATGVRIEMWKNLLDRPVPDHEEGL